MLELFQSIAAKPLEWLAGLGISTATIFTIIKVIGLTWSLITKKSRKAKELLQLDKDRLLAQETGKAMAKTLASDDDFKKDIAKSVVKLLKDENPNKSPIELTSYIGAVLAQPGSERLALNYQQNMSKELNKPKPEPEVEADTTPVEQKIINLTSFGDKPKTKPKKKPKAKGGDIVYDG